MQCNPGVMGWRTVLALMMLVLIGGVSATTMAEPTARMDLRMIMYMAGIKAGTVKLSIDFSDDDAVSSLRLKSKGMVKMITGYKGQSEARTALPKTALQETAWPMPISYDSTYETKKYDRKIQIRYNPDDGNITGLKTWKRGELLGSKVPENLWQATIDPLTAVLQVRHWIFALRNDPSMAQHQTFEVFDGRRRYRLSVDILDRGQANFGGKDLPVFRLKVDLQPLAGFSSKDMLANWSSEDGDRWIELLITDDDNPVPLLLETKGGTLKTSIYLQTLCDGDNRCTEFNS